MFNNINYYQLDEAKKELERRRGQKGLLLKIEEDLNDNFLPFFKNGPISIIWRTIIVPNNSFLFFLSCSEYLGIKPVALEFLGDKFTSVNEDKKKLCKIKIRIEGQYKEIVISDIRKNENKKINEVLLKNDINLVSFYEDLIKYSGLVFKKQDMTGWSQKIGTAKDFYYYFLLHFIIHGILFENFFITSNDKYENLFTKECIIPIINRIKLNYGLDPIIVKIFPETKNDSDELYWWSFPHHINEYLIKYFKKDGLI